MAHELTTAPSPDILIATGQTLGSHAARHNASGADELSLSASQVTVGTFNDGRIAQSNVTQHATGISHLNLADVGTNSHSVIDLHLAAGASGHNITVSGLGGRAVYTKAGPPTATDDSTGGFNQGDFVINISATQGAEITSYQCFSNTACDAIWTPLDKPQATGISAPGGTAGAVQFHATDGSFGGESPFFYDVVNNIVLVDQEIRDATFPFNKITISTSTGPSLAFNFKSALKATVSGNITGGFVVPSQVKSINSSAYGAATEYTVDRFLVIQGTTGASIADTPTLFSNFQIEGVLPKPPSLSTGVVEYFLRSEYTGSHSWRVIGKDTTIRRDVATGSFTISKNMEWIEVTGGTSITLPECVGDDQQIIIANTTSGTIVFTKTSSGDDIETVTGGTATTVSGGDILALQDNSRLFNGTNGVWMRI